VSTLYSADKQWFAKRHITAYNISFLPNPLSSQQGLTGVAHLLAGGTITTRIHFILASTRRAKCSGGFAMAT